MRVHNALPGVKMLSSLSEKHPELFAPVFQNGRLPSIQFQLELQ
jgi:hypothetical protein